MEWANWKNDYSIIIENNYNNIEIKHINNRTNSDVCSAHKYDSIHGKFKADINLIAAI